MNKTASATVGLLVAPFVGALLAVLTSPLVVMHDPLSGLGLLPIFYFFSLLATLVFGIPIFLY